LIFVFIDYFETTLNNFEKSITLKQDEHIFLIGEKDREIAILNQEIVSVKETLSNLKNDRMKDQRIIEELETEILIQNAKSEELNKVLVSLEKEKSYNNEKSKTNLLVIFFLIYTLFRKKSSP
jgi:hypothetical protein